MTQALNKASGNSGTGDYLSSTRMQVNKITLAGTRMYCYDESVARAFSEKGIKVDNIHYRRLTTLIENSPAISRLKDIFNFFVHKIYIKDILKSIPDSQLLVFFGSNKILRYNDLLRIKEKRKIFIIFWLIDSVNSTPDWKKIFTACDLILCYNKDEADMLSARSISSEFMPLAYDPFYYFPSEKYPKEMDVYYVGSISPRIDMLDIIAEKLLKERISFLIDGKLGFFKRMRYAMSGKYSHFRKCSSFKRRNHAQINVNTNKAKICLNIQPKQATSALNIRTYEIIGSGGFQLTDSTPVLDNLFLKDHHLSIYDTVDALIEKIKYFLEESEKRSQIALNGLEEAKNNHAFRCRIEFILKAIRTI